MFSVLPTEATAPANNTDHAVVVTITRKTPLEIIGPDGSILGVTEASPATKYVAVGTTGDLINLQDDKGARYRVAVNSTDYVRMPPAPSDAKPEAPPASPSTADLNGEAVITQRGTNWILENDVLKSIVSFSGGSITMLSFFNRESGKEYLTGPGVCTLFRHKIDGIDISANDGSWTLGKVTINEISAFDRHWGKSLFIDISNSKLSLTITLVFEIYDGRAGLRYGTFLRNDDFVNERTISSSDIIDLNFPNQPHTIYYVPWQTKWARTTGNLENGKRNCITRYDTGDGWALIPENNWCTSLKAGTDFPGSGDPKNPFLFLNAWSGNPDVKVQTNPTAVQFVLFPNERFEYFWVDLQVFKGDEWDARTAVEEHFRERFKYHDPLPKVEFQEYQVDFLQEDSMVRKFLAPALSDAGFDRWEVTWRWNGSDADDRTEPRPGFTNNLPNLADFVLSKGLKIGYYFSMTGDWWGKGRDLADPAQIDFKQQQVEGVLINKYHCTWQMIDLGEMWLNDKLTSYSHPTDNVYRKYVLLRNYMTNMALKYPDFTPLTTCETENPNQVGSECVSLMILGDSGETGSYCRTDNDCGAPDQSSQSNLSDAFNFIGLMPLESFVGVYGENGHDPAPNMFQPSSYYATLLSGCSTFYSDVRNWTTEQKANMRLFNDWKKNPRISSVLNQVARPLCNGDGNNNQGPYAWMYLDKAKTTGLLIGINFSTDSGPSVKLRGLDSTQNYLVEDITLGHTGFAYRYRGSYTGASLMSDGLNLIPSGSDVPCTALWIKESTPNHAQLLYADANVLASTEHIDEASSSLSMQLSGVPNSTAHLVVAKQDKRGVENRDVSFDFFGSAKVSFDFNKVDEHVAKATN